MLHEKEREQDVCFIILSFQPPIMEHAEFGKKFANVSLTLALTMQFASLTRLVGCCVFF